MTTVERIKRMIVDEMYLEGITFDGLVDDAPLFGDGTDSLGLDSLDAIELVLLVKARFAVAIRDVDEGRLAFRSINALAEYIDQRLAEHDD